MRSSNLLNHAVVMAGLIMFSAADLRALNLTRESLDYLTKTYSELLAKDQVLARIERERPEFAGQARAVREGFERKFPNATARLAESLKPTMGKDQKKILGMLKDEAAAEANGYRLTAGEARKLIDIYNNFSRSFPTSFQYMLSVLYEAAPVNEMMDGYTKTPKLKFGSRLVYVSYPASWKRLKADGHLAVWRNEGGSGLENFTLGGIESGRPGKLTDKDYARLAREIVPKGAEVLESGSSASPGKYWLIYRAAKQVSGQTVYATVMNLHVPAAGAHMVLSTSYLSLPADRAKAIERLHLYKPVLERIASSLRFESAEETE